MESQGGAASSARAGDASLGELDPVIARLVRKLASRKWVLLYDSLKATFSLQAEGIAREAVFETAAAAAADAAAVGASGKGKGEALREERGGGGLAHLEGLKGCLAAWGAYKDWCEEVRQPPDRTRRVIFVGLCVFYT